VTARGYVHVVAEDAVVIDARRGVDDTVRAHDRVRLNDRSGENHSASSQTCGAVDVCIGVHCRDPLDVVPISVGKASDYVRSNFVVTECRDAANGAVSRYLVESAENRMTEHEVASSRGVVVEETSDATARSDQRADDDLGLAAGTEHEYGVVCLHWVSVSDSPSFGIVAWPSALTP